MKPTLKYMTSIAIVICLSTILNGQATHWNLVVEKYTSRFFGRMLLETDSCYIIIGQSVNIFNFIEQGFSVSKVSKKDGSLLATVQHEEINKQFDFLKVKKYHQYKNKIYFPQRNGVGVDEIKLFSVDKSNLEILGHLNVNPSEFNSAFFYMHDFIGIEDNVYILASYFTGVIDTPSEKYWPIIIKYNLESKEHKYITLGEGKDFGLSTATIFNDGLLIALYIPGQNIATGKLVLQHIDLEGNVLNTYEAPNLSPIHSCLGITPINDNEILMVSNTPFVSGFKSFFKWTVTRFDMSSKKLIWSTSWNEPQKEFVWASAGIIKGNKNTEYILVANDYEIDNGVEHSLGKVVKFTESGQRIWQKTYFYFKDSIGGFNKFENIVKTSDNYYTMIGYVFNGPYQDAWLVKIDENGNILPIDTTTAIADPDILKTIPEIKIYPNPASHTIIINQGEIADMTYQLTDMTGAVMKTIPLPHAHHHVVWDISDVASGTYVLTMLQGGKVIGGRQQVVIK
jgi:hypothetical protein